MENSSRLCIPCSVCGQDTYPPTKVPKGFHISAYDSMLEWMDASETRPGISKHIWNRCVKTPIKNEKRIVNVSFPFNFALNDRFWSFYQPANAYLNGFSAPEEFELVAAVQCRFDEIYEQNGHSAWVGVTIMEVIGLREMCDKWPVYPCNDYLDEILDSPYHGLSEKFGDWVECSWSAQSDLGAWAILLKQNFGKYHMVAYGEWDFHKCDVYFGNIKTSRKIIEKKRRITYL